MTAVQFPFVIQKPNKRGRKRPAKRIRGYTKIRAMNTKAAQARARGLSRLNYVDGYIDLTNVHQLDENADDTWADCELNPRQVTAVYGCLPIPRVGTGFADRNDRVIFMKNIKIRGFVRFPQLDTETSSHNMHMVRILIVKDTRTNGIEAQAEDVLGPGNGSDGQAVVSGDGGAVNFLTRPSGWGRYKVLRDFILRAPPQPNFHDGTDGAQNGMLVPFKINIKANCYVNFSGTTGAIGSVIDNSFHFFAAQSGDTGGDIAISYTARTSFLDA